MQTVQLWIGAPWKEIYGVVSNIQNWPLWNGAVQEVKHTDRSDEFAIRVNILGWVHCSVKEPKSQENRFKYELFGKGNRETGTLRLVEESSDRSLIEYQVEHNGWLKMIAPLESVTSWRLGRLKELCENQAVLDPFGPGLAR